MAYCVRCDTLRTVLPGPQKWGSTERVYKPIMHDAPAVHAGCGGEIEYVEDATGHSRELHAICTRCDLAVGHEHIIPSQRCDGHKYAVK